MKDPRNRFKLHLLSSAMWMAPTGYIVTNSARFLRTGSTYLTRTPSVTGNQQKFTISCWFKVGETKTASYSYALWSCNNDINLWFNSNYIDQIQVTQGATNLRTTNALYRDPSGWYHVVLAVDTTTQTVNLYVNGSQVTSFAVSNAITLNYNSKANQSGQPQYFGAQTSAGGYWDGYLAECYQIDGQALTPSSFGKVDSNGVWVPIKYSGTYGTNGCKLEFKGSGSSVYTATGSTFGNMTANGGLAAASDGVTSQAYLSSAAYNGADGYVGKAFSSAQLVSEVVFYGPNDASVGNAAATSTVTIYGKATAPSTYNDGTVLGSAVVGNGTSVVQTIACSGITSYAYVWAHVNNVGASQVRCAELVYKTGATLGTDTSGNGNNWTVNGSPVQTSDTPTNNYCTLNPLDYIVDGSTISNGNLTISGSSVGNARIKGTIALTSGRWYFRAKVGSVSGSAPMCGVAIPGTGTGLGVGADNWVIAANGFVGTSNTWTATGLGAHAANDYMDVAVDVSAGKVWFGKNGVWVGNPDAGTGASFTNLTSPVFPILGDTVSGTSLTADFQTAAPANSTTFNTICTANLSGVAVTTSGTFTGNAAADGPFVWTNGNPATLTINGNVVTFGTHADKTAGGFKLRTSSASYNTSGSNTWTATAGNRFVGTNGTPNTAQANP